MIWQKEVDIGRFERGYHIVTHELEKHLPELPRQGLLNIFIKHTSAAITINENADASVRDDFSSFIDKWIPEGDSCYSHVLEGEDDIPAHIKSSVLGTSLNIPISNYQLNLGTWQGIYLCEFRNYGGNRKLVLTIYH